METHTEWFDLSTEPVTLGTDASNLEMLTSEPLLEQDPTIIFCSTGFRGDINYGSYFYYDDIEYYQHLCEVITTLADVDGFDLICKFHPKDKIWNPLADELRSNTAVNVYYQDSFSELLPEADVVLIDYPSTTLLDTLLAGKLLVYLDIGWWLWMPEGKKRLENCVYWVDKDSIDWRQKLVDAVDTAVTNGKKGEYREFLQAFCRPEYDAGQLSERLFGPELDT
jgi:hypothetical protein